MAVKAVEMTRKIRDAHYEDTKGLSIEKQIKDIKKRSKRFQEELNRIRRRASSPVGK